MKAWSRVVAVKKDVRRLGLYFEIQVNGQLKVSDGGVKGKESRILSWLWPEQPNICGISANAIRAK